MTTQNGEPSSGCHLEERLLGPADADTFRAEFEREYTRLFARHIPNASIEIMSWVVLATTATEPPTRLETVAPRPAPAAIGERTRISPGSFGPNLSPFWLTIATAFQRF